MPHEVGVGWTVTHFQLNLGLALFTSFISLGLLLEMPHRRLYISLICKNSCHL